MAGKMKKRNVFMCNGCPKSPGWSATGESCSVYADPQKTYPGRNGGHCPFNPPRPKESKKKFVNPLKASKRGDR
jgi:hypothetical protein